MFCIFNFSGTFEDKEITHVEGEVDPVRDLDIINEELRLKDEESFLKVFDDLEKKYTRGEKKLKVEYVRFFLIFLILPRPLWNPLNGILQNV